MDDISFILNELGEDRQNYYNAVSPPLMQTSNFAFGNVDDLRRAFADEFETNIYSRGQNPTLTILRKKLAALDGAEDALLFNSGIAAISITLLALLKAGDHVIAVENLYSWTQRLFKELLPKFGVTATIVPGNNIEEFEAAVQPNTKLIFLESPSTNIYSIQDLKAVATFARSKGILTMIDNSYCTPLFQQPIKLGIDLAAQSATKYLGGHSDLVAGVVTGSSVLIKRIFSQEYMNLGPALSPQSAWLLLRGLRTLPLRLNRSYQSANTVTSWLQQHPLVEQVLWPFNPEHPQFALAQKQMKGCGGLFSIVLKNSSLEKIETFCNNLKHFLLAVSWGGHESLIVPAAAALSRAAYDADNKAHQCIRI
jgi:cystathionine beta-lyase/cystathionine gamma-synthase